MIRASYDGHGHYDEHFYAIHAFDAGKHGLLTHAGKFFNFAIVQPASFRDTPTAPPSARVAESFNLSSVAAGRIETEAAHLKFLATTSFPSSRHRNTTPH